MLAEPVTTLTDYAMALEAICLAMALLWENELNFQRSRFFWGIAFGWTAIAAAVGGTCHGFAQILTLSVLNFLWTLMGYGIGCASSFMLLGTLWSAVAGGLRWLALILAGGKSVFYFAQVGQYQQFVPMAIDYGAAMLLVLLLQLHQLIAWPRVQHKDQRQSAFWISVGIGTSVLAIGILALRLAIVPWLNHNDIYHLVQMVALYLLYRGVRLLKDF